MTWEHLCGVGAMSLFWEGFAAGFVVAAILFVGAVAFLIWSMAHHIGR